MKLVQSFHHKGNILLLGQYTVQLKPDVNILFRERHKNNYSEKVCESFCMYVSPLTTFLFIVKFTLCSLSCVLCVCVYLGVIECPIKNK